MKNAFIIALAAAIFGCGGPNQEWTSTQPTEAQTHNSTWDSTDFITYYLLYRHFATPTQHVSFSRHMATIRPPHLVPPRTATQRTFFNNFTSSVRKTRTATPSTVVKNSTSWSSSNKVRSGSSTWSSSKPTTTRSSSSWSRSSSSSFRSSGGGFRSGSIGRGS